MTEVNRGVANTKNLIRLPVNITEEIRRVKYTERMLTQELQREPTETELAERLGTTTKRIAHLNSILNKEPVSLDSFNADHLKEDDDN